MTTLPDPVPADLVTPMEGDASPGAAAAPEVELAHRPLQPGQLTDGWRWVLSVGWALLIPALMALGDAAHSFGKPTWWLDTNGMVAWWTPLIFLAPVAVATAGALNWRHWPVVAAVGVAALAATAIVDAGSSPGVALGEGGLALAGLCTSLSALAGRVRRAELIAR